MDWAGSKTQHMVLCPSILNINTELYLSDYMGNSRESQLSSPHMNETLIKANKNVEPTWKKLEPLTWKQTLLPSTINRPMRILAYELMKEELWKQKLSRLTDFPFFCLRALLLGLTIAPHQVPDLPQPSSPAHSRCHISWWRRPPPGVLLYLALHFFAKLNFLTGFPNFSYYSQGLVKPWILGWATTNLTQMTLVCWLDKVKTSILFTISLPVFLYRKDSNWLSLANGWDADFFINLAFLFS